MVTIPYPMQSSGRWNGTPSGRHDVAVPARQFATTAAAVLAIRARADNHHDGLLTVALVRGRWLVAPLPPQSSSCGTVN